MKDTLPDIIEMLLAGFTVSYSGKGINTHSNRSIKKRNAVDGELYFLIIDI
ncbi:MAG: hypothetical protein HQ591_01835 [candidate division Zixibacteria bacterium]|nr:hypothetical protein [Candidatus Tariuqbacter arcticus]